MKSVGNSADKTKKHLDRVNNTLKTVGRTAALGLAAGVAVAAAAMVKFVADADESRRVSRLTAAVLKSTGGAAKVTAKHVDELATAISNKTGIDDEAVQTAENLLLTFTNLRNEVGAGNKIFDRATIAATNMAAAMGTEPKKAAIQLGKALNDPIKGITALSKSGVSFTQGQKDQIKTLVESGKTMQAQKLILHELGKEFGGAAEAAASPLEKLKTTLGNMGETIGLAVLPYVDRFAAWLGKTGPDGANKFSTFLTGKLIPAVQRFGGWIRDDLAPALKTFGQDALTGIQGFFTNFSSGFGGTKSTTETFKTGLKGLGTTITDVVIPAVGTFIKVTLPALGKQMALQIKAALIFGEAMADMAAAGIHSYGGLLRGALQALGGIIHGIDKVRFLFPTMAGQIHAAAGKFDGFRAKAEAGLKSAEKNARNTAAALRDLRINGFPTGLNFTQSLAAGIRAGTGASVAAAQGVANKVAAAMRGPSGFDEGSPSKVGIKLGRYFSEGIAEGLRKGGKDAIAAAKSLADNVAAKVAEIRGKIAAIRDSVGGAVRGILDVSQIGAAIESTTSVTTPGTPGRSVIDPITGAVTTTAGTEATTSDVTTSRTPTVGETLGGFAAQAKAFAAALATMAAHKLAPSLIAAVAAAGPVSGLTAANALAALSPAGVVATNADIGAIDAAAKAAGTSVISTTRLPAELKREQQLVDEVKGMRADLAGKKVASLEITDGGTLIVRYVNDTNKKNARKK